MSAGPDWLTDEVDLAFASSASGRVHVLLPTDMTVERHISRLVQLGLAHANGPATRLMAAATRYGTLCGRDELRAENGGTWRGVSAFADDRLCARCMRALGDKSVRAFDSDRPEVDPYNEDR